MSRRGSYEGSWFLKLSSDRNLSVFSLDLTRQARLLVSFLYSQKGADLLCLRLHSAALGAVNMAKGCKERRGNRAGETWKKTALFYSCVSLMQGAPATYSTWRVSSTPSPGELCRWGARKKGDKVFIYSLCFCLAPVHRSPLCIRHSSQLPLLATVTFLP